MVITGAEIEPPEEATDVLVDDVISANNPKKALFNLVRKYHASKPRLCVAVYRAVSERIDVSDYWIYHIVSEALVAIGDLEAAFRLAVTAVEMNPAARSWHLYRTMFRYHMGRGREPEAIDAILRSLERTPDLPLLDPREIRALLKRNGIPLPAALGQDITSAHPAPTRCLQVIERQTIRLAPPRQIGGEALALRVPWQELEAPAITVSELTDATIVIQDSNILIIDAHGVLRDDLCIAGFPAGVLAKFQQIQSAGDLAAERDCASAVVIKDRFSGRNVSHFLLDHMPRLELYRRAGADIAASTVISEPLVAPFMRVIADAFGIHDVVGSDQRSRIRVARLFVTDNCTVSHRHPAHYMSPWAVDSIRRAFGESSVPPEERHRKLYISRQDAAVRKVRNEAEVCILLEAAGFQTIVAGELPYLQQISLFREATHIVGMHGAGLSNAIFCAPGTEILEFLHPVGSNPDYATLSIAAGLKYTALVCGDAEESHPIWNDPDLPASARDAAGGGHAMNRRDVHVPIHHLEHWLDEIGTA